MERTSRVKTRGLAGSNSAAMKWKNTFSRHKEWRRTECTAAMEPRRLTKGATRPVSVIWRLDVVEECVVVCGCRERADSEAKQWWEEEAENEGGNDGALAEEKNLEEWSMAKSVLVGRKQKGCCCCWVLEGKKMAFSLEPGWRRGKFQSEKERKSWSFESKKKLSLRLKIVNYFTCLSDVDTWPSTSEDNGQRPIGTSRTNIGEIYKNGRSKL